MHRLLTETMRKYPAAGVLNKTCTQRYQLPGTDLKIEVGTPVALPVYALHYDPKYFPDPQRFDPDRFNDENKKNRVSCTYMTFGEGPRSCIGKLHMFISVESHGVGEGR